MQKKKKPEPTKRTTLRLSPALYDRIQQSATYHGNTLNAEIVARLEASTDEDGFDRLSRELADLRGLVLDAIKK